MRNFLLTILRKSDIIMTESEVMTTQCVKFAADLSVLPPAPNSVAELQEKARLEVGVAVAVRSYILTMTASAEEALCSVNIVTKAFGKPK